MSMPSRIEGDPLATAYAEVCEEVTRLERLVLDILRNWSKGQDTVKLMQVVEQLIVADDVKRKLEHSARAKPKELEPC